MRNTMKSLLMIVVSLGVVLGSGCAKDQVTQNEPTTPTPPVTTPIPEGEGPGWTLQDTTEKDGDIKLEGGNSLPRPPGDSSSNDNSGRSSDSSSSP